MNACSSSSLSAWAPPWITFIIGTGSTCAFGPPMARYRGRSRASAAACATASETPRSAFAPRFDLPAEPSRSSSSASIARWSSASSPATAGAIAVTTLSIAFRTPLPPNRFGSPSRSSRASCSPVEAPLGTAARPNDPSSRYTSTSIVGLPRESRISRAWTASIAGIADDCSARGTVDPDIRAGSGCSGTGEARPARELVEPELRVQLCRPVLDVGVEEAQVRPAGSRLDDRARHDRGREPAVPEAREGADVLDLGDGPAGIEVAAAPPDPLDERHEEARAGLGEHPSMVGELSDNLLRGGVRLGPQGLANDRDVGVDVHLLDRSDGRTGRLATVDHRDETVPEVAEPGEPRGGPPRRLLVVEDHVAVREPRGAQHAVALGRELGRANALERRLDPEQVAVPPERVALVEVGGPPREGLGTQGGPSKKIALEGAD